MIKPLIQIYQGTGVLVVYQFNCVPGVYMIKPLIQIYQGTGVHQFNCVPGVYDQTCNTDISRYWCSCCVSV